VDFKEGLVHLFYHFFPKPFFSYLLQFFSLALKHSECKRFVIAFDEANALLNIRNVIVCISGISKYYTKEGF
jgi:hypothetical protein